MSFGVLTPHLTPGPELEFATMSARQVSARIARLASSDPNSAEALRALTSPVTLTQAADALANTNPYRAIGYASTTSAYVIGYDAETALMAQLSQHTGLPVASTGAAAVHALRAFEIERIALIGAPWFDPDYNRLGAAYFTSQGLEVVSSASANLPKDPDAIDPAAVAHWAAGHLDHAAQAVFIGGNGFRVAGAIKPLETSSDRLVLTANQVLLWQLLADTSTRLPITGYGQLFTHRP